jgi:hypothetical protein
VDAAASLRKMFSYPSNFICHVYSGLFVCMQLIV